MNQNKGVHWQNRFKYHPDTNRDKSTYVPGEEKPGASLRGQGLTVKLNDLKSDTLESQMKAKIRTVKYLRIKTHLVFIGYEVLFHQFGRVCPTHLPFQGRWFRLRLGREAVYRVLKLLDRECVFNASEISLATCFDSKNSRCSLI